MKNKFKEFFKNLGLKIKGKPFHFAFMLFLFLTCLSIVILSFIPRQNSRSAFADVPPFDPSVSSSQPYIDMSASSGFTLYSGFYFINDSASLPDDSFYLPLYSASLCSFDFIPYVYLISSSNTSVNDITVQTNYLLTALYSVDSSTSATFFLSSYKYNSSSLFSLCKISVVDGVRYSLSSSYDNLRLIALPYTVTLDMSYEYDAGFYSFFSTFCVYLCPILEQSSLTSYPPEYSNWFNDFYVQGWFNGATFGDLENSISYRNGFSAGRVAGRNEALTEKLANPISFMIEPVITFMDTKLFGVVSIGSLLSVVLFVAVACIFLKMFAGG